MVFKSPGDEILVGTSRDLAFKGREHFRGGTTYMIKITSNEFTETKLLTAD
jgi:hypothetical protein